VLASLFGDVNTIEWLHPEEGGPDGAERQLSGNMMSSRLQPEVTVRPGALEQPFLAEPER